MSQPKRARPAQRYAGARKLIKVRVGEAENLPVSFQVGRHSGTISSAARSGVSRVSGSSPGITVARIRVLIGPGLNRLTRSGVEAVSLAHTRARVSMADFEAA